MGFTQGDISSNRGVNTSTCHKETTMRMFASHDCIFDSGCTDARRCSGPRIQCPAARNESSGKTGWYLEVTSKSSKCLKKPARPTSSSRGNWFSAVDSSKRWGASTTKGSPTSRGCTRMTRTERPIAIGSSCRRGFTGSQPELGTRAARRLLSQAGLERAIRER